MAKSPKSPPPPGPSADADTRDRPRPDRTVQSGVLAALGRPPGLYEVDVRPLWANHFRVNVLVGTDPTAVRIAHSYFVEAGEAGDILASTPRITRLYM